MRFKFLNKNLVSFWGSHRKIKKARYRVLYGGRTSSKSHEFATMIVVLALRYKLKVLCTRAFQNRIKDSVKALLEQKIEALGVNQYYDISNTQITTTNGSQFLFYGLSRNTEEIKSIEGVDICYIEEAQYITEFMWKILTPTIRKEGSEVWISFNPQLRTDFIYNKFIVNKPNSAIVELINYDRNPYLSNTMKVEIEEYKSDPSFSHVYLGECNDDDELAIISYSNLLLCVGVVDKFNLSFNNNKKIGFDVGDGGQDPNAVCYRENIEICDLFEFELQRDMIDVASKRVFDYAKEKRCKVIIYDSIGVGAGVGGFIRLYSGNIFSVEPTGFIASAKPQRPNGKYKILGEATKIKNSEYFTNLKIQKWIHFRDRVNLTAQLVRKNNKEELLKRKDEIVSFNPNLKLLDKCLIELSTPYLIQKDEGKIMVESKEKLLDRGIKSHNLADSVIMAFSEIKSGW